MQWGREVDFLGGLIAGPQPTGNSRGNEKNQCGGCGLQEVGLNGRSTRTGFTIHLELFGDNGLATKARQW